MPGILQNITDWQRTIPFVHDALWLLAWGVVIPLIVGLLGRLFVTRDVDDAHRKDSGKMKPNPERALAVESPEPKPLICKPWPKLFPSKKRHRSP
jgi:hypothetical protein